MSLGLYFKCCSQAKLRLEMEMERQRQTHSKEIESKDEEVDDIRRSCSKKVGAGLFPPHLIALFLCLELRVYQAFSKVALANRDLYSQTCPAVHHS